MTYVLDVPRHKKSQYFHSDDKTMTSLKENLVSLLPNDDSSDCYSFFSLYNGRKVPLTTDAVTFILFIEIVI